MSTPRQTRIIVVDDDAKLRELLRRHLAEHGFEVLVAPDGQSLDRLMLRDRPRIHTWAISGRGRAAISACKRRTDGSS